MPSRALEDSDRLRLVNAALRLSPTPSSRLERRQTIQEIEDLARRARESLPQGATARQSLEAINDVLFRQEGFRGTVALEDPRSLSLAALLRDKRGTCVSLVILYLAVAERVGVDASAAATPVHLFVRHDGPDGILNVETLEGGRFVDDATYRARYRMADESVVRGEFLSALADRAVLAHFLSNRGVIAAAAGRRRQAMRDFNRALNLYPDLEAAWYNRGLENLKAGRFEAGRKDLSRAIEIHPLDAQAFNNRGLASLKLNDDTAARSDFETALRIEPGQKEAGENLRHLSRAGAKTP